jgi:uncharacterized membrane protein YfcA
VEKEITILNLTTPTGSFESLLVLLPIFFIVSFFYSSVGFAGGSSYTAILVLAGVDLFAVPPLALILNIAAASMAFINYLRAGHLSIKFALPFLSSVPFAFLGGTVTLPEKDLALVFVIALFAASAALLISSRNFWRHYYYEDKRNHKLLNKLKNSKFIFLLGLPVGAILGSIAGLVGIGGGIWLSPLLILTGLAEPKRAAATASMFILVNSVSGLIAHSLSKHIDFLFLVPLLLTVLAGGLLGSKIGAFKFNHDRVRTIVGILVAVAGVVIMFRTYFS